MSDLYTILGIKQNATQEEIKQAYHTMAKKHHPDAGGNNEKMAQITQAYAVLKNPLKRAHYDKTGQTEQSSFEQKFTAFANSVLMQMIEKHDVKSVDLVQEFKNQLIKAHGDIQQQKKSAQIQLEKFIVIKKRLTSKGDITILKIVDNNIATNNRAINSINEDLECIAQCQKLLEDYQYQFDAAQQSIATLIINM